MYRNIPQSIPSSCLTYLLVYLGYFHNPIINPEKKTNSKLLKFHINSNKQHRRNNSHTTLQQKVSNRSTKFYNAKSSLPDENSTYYRNQQKEKKETTPLQITYIEEDPSNQNHELIQNFAAR